MKSLKLKVIAIAILVGVFSAAMAGVDPQPNPQLSDFTQGTISCMNSANYWGNKIYNYDWSLNQANLYLSYATLLTSTISKLSYDWNTSCNGSVCTGTTTINCESMNSISYPDGLSPAINAAAQGYMKNVLANYYGGTPIPAGTEVQCSINQGTCTIK